MSELLRAFRFDVQLFRSLQSPLGTVGVAGAAPSGSHLGEGGFQECTGLELESDVKEYLEGGRNDEVLRRVGRVKLQPIVLKRGMVTKADTTEPDLDLWMWFQSVVGGARPAVRYDGIITVHHPNGRTALARWIFWRGLPMKVKGPTLNAETGQVAIEELHIAHEGLVVGR